MRIYLLYEKIKPLLLSFPYFSFQSLLCSEITTINRNYSIDTSTDLKSILAAQIPKEINRIKNFRKQYGTTKISDITVDMVMNNIRTGK